LQREGIVTHVIADHLEDLTPRLRALAGPDFKTTDRRRTAGAAYENSLSRADGVKNPGADTRQTSTRSLFPSRDFH
jgi:hypothetical protein